VRNNGTGEKIARPQVTDVESKPGFLWVDFDYANQAAQNWLRQ
jgi:hypothetical protein